MRAGTIRLMSMTPEYQTALDALSRAADTMTRSCNAYEMARAPGSAATSAAEIETLRVACDQARNAHDEALADAWDLIESQPG
ncbi:MAG: hypothetical protein O2826_02355 [Chloroflexi bacterium]|nr:hypothetical protein [Chloroflexota bacterium]MDA1173340.1 hypothetical protein [Chloroflexota bacterium]